MEGETSADELSRTIPSSGNSVEVEEESSRYIHQCLPKSRPVSFYDNFKVVATMSPCVTSALSVGNLSQIRDNGSTRSSKQLQQQQQQQQQQHAINNNMEHNNNNNNNRVNSAVSAGNVYKLQPSKVSGAVSTGNIGKTVRSDQKELGRAPSMANSLSTTVPVNLAASQIAGRHTPTRNSLRHSRMIVMHRTGHMPRKTQPPLVRHRKLAQALAALQVIFGLAITSLSLWLLLWAPHLPLIDNPYWSGIPLLLSGSFGICLLCCFKKEYPGMNPGCCLTSTKVTSAFLAGCATLACIVACLASAWHLVRLTGLECAPAHVLNTTCLCKPPADGGIFTTALSPSNHVSRYLDLNCLEVEGILTVLLIFSSSSNAIGGIIAGWYCYLHWTTRDKRPKYARVRTSLTKKRNISSPPIYNPTCVGTHVQR